MTFLHCVKISQLSQKYSHHTFSKHWCYTFNEYLVYLNIVFSPLTWVSDFSYQSLPLQYLACQHRHPKECGNEGKRRITLGIFGQCLWRQWNPFMTFDPLWRFVSFWRILSARLRSFRARSTDLIMMIEIYLAHAVIIVMIMMVTMIMAVTLMMMVTMVISIWPKHQTVIGREMMQHFISLCLKLFESF